MCCQATDIWRLSVTSGNYLLLISRGYWLCFVCLHPSWHVWHLVNTSDFSIALFMIWLFSPLQQINRYLVRCVLQKLACYCSVRYLDISYAINCEICYLCLFYSITLHYFCSVINYRGGSCTRQAKPHTSTQTGRHCSGCMKTTPNCTPLNYL